MTKETSRSKDGRKLIVTNHEEIADFKAIVAAVLGHFDGKVVKKVEVWTLGQMLVRIQCGGELVDVDFDEAWGISISTESESPIMLQAIAEFLETYLPKYRDPGKTRFSIRE